MKKYVVEITNEILGNSKHIMTKEQIKKFNICAYKLCQYVDVAGGIHTAGMWTVREALEKDLINQNLKWESPLNQQLLFKESFHVEAIR